MVGPSWWADSWVDRDGQPVRGRPAREQRTEQAATETAGLNQALDHLPDDADLVLVGASGATRLASRWADTRPRLPVRVPAEAFARDMATAMVAGGHLVKVLACAPTADAPDVMALRAWAGVAVQAVVPFVPEPDPEPEPV